MPTPTYKKVNDNTTIVIKNGNVAVAVWHKTFEITGYDQDGNHIGQLPYNFTTRQQAESFILELGDIAEEHYFGESVSLRVYERNSAYPLVAPEPPFYGDEFGQRRE